MTSTIRASGTSRTQDGTSHQTGGTSQRGDIVTVRYGTATGNEPAGVYVALTGILGANPTLNLIDAAIGSISLNGAGPNYERSGTVNMPREQVLSRPNLPDPTAKGKLAASNSKVTTSNPYPTGTKEHAKWLDGYKDALDTEDGMASDFA
jgi:hypothetical protein